eukprot:5340706-Prymnesium_polylepis.1
MGDRLRAIPIEDARIASEAKQGFVSFAPMCHSLHPLMGSLCFAAGRRFLSTYGVRLMAAMPFSCTWTRWGMCSWSCRRRAFMLLILSCSKTQRGETTYGWRTRTHASQREEGATCERGLRRAGPTLPSPSVRLTSRTPHRVCPVPDHRVARACRHPAAAGERT